MRFTPKSMSTKVYFKILFCFVFFLSLFVCLFVYLFIQFHSSAIHHLLQFVYRYRKCTCIHALCTSYFQTAPSMDKCMHRKVTWHYVHRNTQLVATITHVCLELTVTPLFTYFVYSLPSLTHSLTLSPSIHSFIPL